MLLGPLKARVIFAPKDVICSDSDRLGEDEFCRLAIELDILAVKRDEKTGRHWTVAWAVCCLLHI